MKWADKVLCTGSMVAEHAKAPFSEGVFVPSWDMIAERFSMIYKSETPQTVHGRLLQSAHISGYTFQQACEQLEWLIDEDRWKELNFDCPKAFIGSIDLSDFKIDAPHRKKLVKKLSKLEASQRAIAKAIGVTQSTVNGDLASDQNRSPVEPEPAETLEPKCESDQNRSPAQNDGREAAKAASKKKTTIENRQMKEEIREARRAENRNKVSGVISLDDIVAGGAKFATIVLDPPWDWSDEGDQDQFGRARPQYETLGIDEVASLPIGNISDVDYHLYLWITNRSLPKGFRLLEEWGFRYVTAVTWVKPHFGMGNYFRGQTEHVLFGVKGSQALKRKDVGTVFNAPRGPDGHSSKPQEFYDLVESCSPGPYFDGFSRQDREGWTTWGESS